MTVPTTDDIRAVWAAEVEREFFELDGEAQFDAWLAGVVRKAQAEALREAARAEFQSTFGVSYSGLDAQERLFRKADRIEQNSEGNET